MNNLLPFKKLLLVVICFLSALYSSKAAIIVQSFGEEGVVGPYFLSELNTTFGPTPDIDPEYHAINSSNEDIKFVRHIVDSDNCLYWFRADSDPTQYGNTEYWSNVYWYVGNIGENQCFFPDGAKDGSNNYVLLYSVSGERLVGVLQYDLNDSNDDLNNPARLLAYAIDMNGLTYADAVSAIQNIPEPSTVTLSGLALMAGLSKLRRRRS